MARPALNGNTFRLLIEIHEYMNERLDRFRKKDTVALAPPPFMVHCYNKAQNMGVKFIHVYSFIWFHSFIKCNRKPSLRASKKPKKKKKTIQLGNTHQHSQIFIVFGVVFVVNWHFNWEGKGIQPFCPSFASNKHFAACRLEN